VKHFIKDSDTEFFSGSLEIQTRNFSTASEIRIISKNLYYLHYILNRSRYGAFYGALKKSLPAFSSLY